MGQRVKFLDFKKHYKLIRKQVDGAIGRVFDNGIFILGPEVKNFEEKFAKYLGVKNVIGLASGTDALTLAIKSLGLKTDDEIIVPANVYPTVFGVSLAGSKVKLADVNPNTLNIDLENIKKVVSKKTKAVVAVHLYGNPVDLNPIKEFCKENKLFLIEDCAQATGAVYKNKKVGSIGDIACFSFYPTKNLGAFGDGGAVATNSRELADHVRSLRMYGEVKRYESVEIGQNSRLDEIHAAVLTEKLKFLDKWTKRRRVIAKTYKDALGKVIFIPKEVNGGQSCYHLFVLQVDNRDDFMKYLNDNDIDSGVHYPVPIHLTPSFSFLKKKKGSFPVSEKSANTVVSLPMYAEMEDSDVKKVVKAILHYFNK